MKLTAHLFDWPSRHNVHLALPLFLIFSFILHAAGVLVFQIYYPRSSDPPFRSAQVYFLQPKSPEAVALAPMLEASDPALFSPVEPFGPHVLTLPGIEYVPGFGGSAPALEPLPSTSSQPMAALPVRMEAIHAVSSQPIAAGLPTTVQLSGGLKDRKMTPPKDFIFSAPPRQMLEPVEFLVAVSPEGLPVHVAPLFPEARSGVESVDHMALAYLLQSRFEPVPEAAGVTWGYAKFLWGADIERRKEP